MKSTAYNLQKYVFGLLQKDYFDDRHAHLIIYYLKFICYLIFMI